MKTTTLALLTTVATATTAIADGHTIVIDETKVINQPVVVENTIVTESQPVYASPITNLNMRDWPSNQGNILDVIPPTAEIYVESCNADGWCLVQYGTLVGYAYGEYLVATFDAEPVRLTPTVTSTYIPNLDYEYPEGYIAPAERIVSPTPTYYTTYQDLYVEPVVTQYILANPVETVYLQGEVAPGAVIPTTVPTYSIPSYNYHYANINGYPVLVDPSNRSVVYVNY